MDGRVLINAVALYLEQFRWNSPSNAHCRCPICGDSSRHKFKTRFYFLQKENKWNCYCHNCNYSSSLEKFLKKFFPHILDQYTIDFFMEESNVVSTQIPQALPDESFQEWDFSSCIHIKDLSKSHPARVYVEKRKIPFERVLYSSNVNNILPLEEHVKKERSVPVLVIPFYKRNGKAEVFQVRFFDPALKPKYLTFKTSDTVKKVYGLDFVDQSLPVYVTEGPIDSMMVKNCIAVASSDLKSSTQYIKDPVLVFDNEPRAPIICKKIQEAIKKDFQVVIFPNDVQEKDLNDYCIHKGKDEAMSLLQRHTYRGIEAELEFGRWCKCETSQKRGRLAPRFTF